MTYPPSILLKPRPRLVRQGGAAAIMVALSLAMLIGFAGLVLDLGHLYVNKTELQNAADACALAAANELVCDSPTCPVDFLENAEAAGIFVAGRNSTDFQKSAVGILAQDIKFSKSLGPNESYLSRADGALTDSKFAMCTASLRDIAPWFIQVLNNITSLSVQATAVATLAPGQTACNASPIGVCALAAEEEPDTDPSVDYGYTTGQWIQSEFNGGGGPDASDLAGNFRWVDFTPSGGGTNEIRDQLLGKSPVCGIKVGDQVREEGVKQGAKSAWNTRFGIYKKGASAPSPAEAPPDKTGFAYPSAAIAVGTSAYENFREQQAASTPYDGTYPGNTVISSAEHLEFGSERRLVSVPVVQCTGAGNDVTILGMGCVLMLNPMPNGNTGTIYLEWRGMANTSGSPCRTAGVAGGTSGPLVPTLVQ